MKRVGEGGDGSCFGLYRLCDLAARPRLYRAVAAERDDHGGPFGASLICARRALAFLCRLPHPLMLPPGLHVIGLLSAGWVCARLLLRLICALAARARPARDRPRALSRASRPRCCGRRGKSRSPLRQVKPRSQFGLRGRA